MKKIEVIFRPEKLELLKDKLLDSGIKGATIYQVSGCGNQHGLMEYYRGQQVMMNTISKVYLMTVVQDNEVKLIVELIKSTIHTGEVGDGKIFISTVDECIRIRTNETGEAAL